MAAQWKKFDGTDEQIKEMEESDHGYIFRYIPPGGKFEEESDISNGAAQCIAKARLGFDITEYLICQPRRHADMIIRQAKTGQPAYVKADISNKWDLIKNPAWSERCEYSFNHPVTQGYIRYKYRDDAGLIYVQAINKFGSVLKAEEIENASQFIEWIDDDWQEVEV
jgi:hypothetical protein